MKISKYLAGLCSAAATCVAGASPVQLTEGFDDISLLAGSGWAKPNTSSPIGSTSWFQGNTGVFNAAAGVEANSYIAANFLNAEDGGAISNWLMTPVLTLANGVVLDFLVRSAGTYRDMVEVRLSTNGASIDVGATATSLGDFSTLLGTYSTTTDEDWVAESFTMAGLGAPTTGRYAFRYVVGNTANDGNYIGIDSVRVSGSSNGNGSGNTVPEPQSLALVLLALSGLVVVRRRRGAGPVHRRASQEAGQPIFRIHGR